MCVSNDRFVFVAFSIFLGAGVIMLVQLSNKSVIPTEHNETTHTRSNCNANRADDVETTQKGGVRIATQPTRLRKVTSRIIIAL